MGVGHIQTADEVKSHLGGYDTDIHYADYFVGKLIQDLKDLDIYDQTAIIIYADHRGSQISGLPNCLLRSFIVLIVSI